MKSAQFSMTRRDVPMAELAGKASHQTLAVWAIECAGRVLPYFEQRNTHDGRPRRAIETLKHWLDTGVFSMAVIRKASLDAHAAAREVGEDSPARSAARAAGQAVATAHVRRHAIGSAIYAQQAVFRAAEPSKAEAAAVAERDWQYRRLRALAENPA
jgi:hypothetical protein